MHPALITAVAATQRQDSLARAARTGRAARARRDSQPEPGPRHSARPARSPAGRRRLAVPWIR